MGHLYPDKKRVLPEGGRLVGVQCRIKTLVSGPASPFRFALEISDV